MEFIEEIGDALYDALVCHTLTSTTISQNGK